MEHPSDLEVGVVEELPADWERSSDPHVDAGPLRKGASQVTGRVGVLPAADEADGSGHRVRRAQV